MHGTQWDGISHHIWDGMVMGPPSHNEIRAARPTRCPFHHEILSDLLLPTDVDVAHVPPHVRHVPTLAQLVPSQAHCEWSYSRLRMLRPPARVLPLLQWPRATSFCLIVHFVCVRLYKVVSSKTGLALCSWLVFSFRLFLDLSSTSVGAFLLIGKHTGNQRKNFHGKTVV